MKLKEWKAEDILAARKNAGLTQTEMALKMGCRPQTISEWESGLYAPRNAYKRLLNMFFGKSKK